MRKDFRIAAITAALFGVLLSGCQSAPREYEAAGVGSPADAGNELDGSWLGSVRAVGEEYELRVTFTADPLLTGRMDIPGQDKRDLPLVGVWYEPPILHFELETDSEKAIFEGTVSGTAIQGKYTQGPVKGTFSLNRSE